MQQSAYRLATGSLTVLLSGIPMAGQAEDLASKDQFQATVHGMVTVGTQIRTESPNPDAYPFIVSNTLGLAPGKLTGNSGAGDLNFDKGKPVSTVLKGRLDLDVHRGDFGAFVRAEAWTDRELEERNRRYGNYANGFQPNTPLSDKAFAPEARFTNAVFRDAYVYGKFDVGAESPLSFKLGRQVLSWGKSMLTSGGINSAINAVDLPALQRPGAQPDEGKVATGMLSGSLSLTKQSGIDGFIEYEFRPGVLPGCGTFYDTFSVAPPGCEMAAAQAKTLLPPMDTVGALSERSIYQTGYYLHRNPDVKPSPGGQYGLAFRHTFEPIATDFRFYGIQTHGTVPYLRAYVENVKGIGILPSTIQGAYDRMTDPNGIKYAMTYPGSIRLWGAAFDTKLAPTLRAYGEASVRNNAALAWNASDVLASIMLRPPNAMINVAKGLNSLPPGTGYDMFDRFRVSNGMAGLNWILPKALGSEKIVLTGEVGFSHVSHLPDPNVMRYGRSNAFGTAAYVYDGKVATACAETTAANGNPNGIPGKSCTNDGFVTANAWGIRLHASATYPGAWLGATVTPSIYIAKDISGYSYDGVFSKGKLTVRPAVRLDWGKDYFVDIQYTAFSGGKYNLLTDRDSLSLAAGYRF